MYPRNISHVYKYGIVPKIFIGEEYLGFLTQTIKSTFEMLQIAKQNTAQSVAPLQSLKCLSMSYQAPKQKYILV